MYHLGVGTVGGWKGERVDGSESGWKGCVNGCGREMIGMVQEYDRVDTCRYGGQVNAWMVGKEWVMLDSVQGGCLFDQIKG